MIFNCEDSASKFRVSFIVKNRMSSESIGVLGKRLSYKVRFRARFIRGIQCRAQSAESL
jgi:hypothetical protein